MNPTIFSIVPLAALAGSFFLPAVARAEAPVLIWGFQRACESLPDKDRAVEKELHKQRGDVALLRSPSGKALAPCTGERCAQAFRAACPSSTARLLGGQVVSSRNIVKTRLWLYDPQTGQTAFQDDYCQSCDLGLATALAAQARRLIDQPRFGAAPGPIPTYCAPSAVQPVSSAGEASRGPIFLTVYGDGKHKAPLLDAVRQQLALRGRQVLAVPGEFKTFADDELKRMVAGQRDAQVLGINLHKDGKQQVFLYDQQTDKIDWKTLQCGECAQDKDVLIAKMQPEIAGMLERCFGWSCAEASARPGGAAPPLEACEPFAETACSDAELFATSGGSAASSPGRNIDPFTAKLVKGGLWGIFAASTATAIGLFAANAAGAGRLVGTYEMNTQPLVNTAYLATALAAVSLGVAIPITLHVNRAQSKASSPPSQSSTPATIQCPN